MLCYTIKKVIYLLEFNSKKQKFKSKTNG